MVKFICKKWGITLECDVALYDDYTLLFGKNHNVCDAKLLTEMRFQSVRQNQLPEREVAVVFAEFCRILTGIRIQKH